MSPQPPVESPLRTYVVRIYRRSEDGASPSVIGTVEPVPGGDRLAFDSLGQLGDILALPAAGARRRRRNDAAAT